jgi:hypothetical protein
MGQSEIIECKFDIFDAIEGGGVMPNFVQHI